MDLKSDSFEIISYPLSSICIAYTSLQPDRNHQGMESWDHSHSLELNICNLCIWSLLDTVHQGWWSFHRSHIQHLGERENNESEFSMMNDNLDICTVCKFDRWDMWSLDLGRMGHMSSQEETWVDTHNPETRSEIKVTDHATNYLADISVWAEWVRVLCQWVAVTLGGETLAHDTPGVPHTRAHLVLLVAVAARVIHWTPGVGQVIRRVGNTHLQQWQCWRTPSTIQ